MKINEMVYVSKFDGQKLKAYVYEVEKPKALVVVFHGMAEHQLRYRNLAERLNKANFRVLTIDHRGHGESLVDGNLKGYFADKDGWRHNLDDLHEIIKEVNAQKPLPILLFGHSMGSIYARSYLRHYGNELHALYLSGSPDESPIAGVGALIAKSISLLRGKKHHSPLLTKLSFGQFNANVEHPKTSNDWLSVDENNVKAYNDDPLCGYDCTAGMFVDMLGGITEVYHGSPWLVPNPQLPIKLESGRMDPCHKPNGIERAAKRLEDLGYKNVVFNYVEGSRHEIYNDVSRLTLMDKLVEWFDSTL